MKKPTKAARAATAVSSKTTAIPNALQSSTTQGGTAQNKAAAKNSNQDAIDLLKADHRAVEKLFSSYEATDDTAEKRELAQKICQELVVHTKLEEELFYPACREKGVESDSLDEAQVEHDGAKVVIADLLQGTPGDPYYDAKVTVLSEYIKHHVGEEEQPRTGIFARAKGAGLDMADLGARLAARKAELMSDQSIVHEPLQTRALQLQDIQTTSEDDTMPRHFNTHDRDNNDRDSRGRFTSDHDGGNRSRSSGNRSQSMRSGRDYEDSNRGNGGSNNNRDRDDQGRFMSDDNDRSYSSRSNYSRDDGYGQNQSRAGQSRDSDNNRDRDDRGRFMSDDDDHRSSSSRSGRSGNTDRDDQGRFMSDDDDNRSYGGRGGNTDRDDRGRFMSDDDDDRSQGRSGNNRDRDEQGRFMSDDDDRSYSSRSNRSQSRGDDEDDSRYGSRGRGQSGRSQMGGSSSRNESYQTQSNQGHGGWFGDHDGHAKAAKRGWQHRG